MIDDTDLASALNILDAKYNDLKDNLDSKYYAKLSVIELCGWIEIAFDKIIFDCMGEKLETSELKSFLRDKIRRTYGFDYKKHFRPMLIVSLGLVKVEEIEKELDTDLFILCSELESLLTHRNNAAHTNVGATQYYPAPSIVKANLNSIKPIINKIYDLACA
ncbi:hypothetical protein ACK24S_000198 [Vibrio fluvialis]